MCGLKYGIVLLWLCSSLRGGCPKILLRVCPSLRSGSPIIQENSDVDLPLTQKWEPQNLGEFWGGSAS